MIERLHGLRGWERRTGGARHDSTTILSVGMDTEVFRIATGWKAYTRKSAIANYPDFTHGRLRQGGNATR